MLKKIIDRISHLSFLAGSAVFLLSNLTHAADYCPSSGNTNFEWIKEVKLGGVSSLSTGDGYKLFSSPVFQLNTGANLIYLNPGYRYGTYTEAWAVFIDFNQDGQFTSTEKVLGVFAGSYVNTNIYVPSTALSGLTRMRVSMQYGNVPVACGSVGYGEVEDYTVNIQASAPPPPPPPPTGTVSTVTNGGFDKAYGMELVVLAKFKRNGVAYNGSYYFYPGSAFARPITIEADSGTQIEWSANVYLDSTPSGVFIPSSCSNIVGNKCFTTAGSVGQSVIFKTQPVLAPAQMVTFENMFGGSTYQQGPTITFEGITATTTAPYFYNLSGAPFSSGYFAFMDLTLGFSAPVKKLTFQAAGSCTNCTQTVQVKVNGQPYTTFTLNYNVIKNIVLDVPTGATSVNFNQNFKMDNLGLYY